MRVAHRVAPLDERVQDRRGQLVNGDVEVNDKPRVAIDAKVYPNAPYLGELLVRIGMVE
jgi:hypothetical protein